jgi:hypothetical protein
MILNIINKKKNFVLMISYLISCLFISCILLKKDGGVSDACDTKILKMIVLLKFIIVFLFISIN